MEAIKAIDYYLLPIYILLATLLIRALKRKLNPDKSTYKIYYISFFLKLSGALLFALIIQYYYGIGDSMTYFLQSKNLHDNVVNDFSNIKYFFCSLEDYKTINNSINGNLASIPYDYSGLLVVRITALFSFLSFNTYLTGTVFFALLSFIGVWALYLTFISIIPDLKKQFAWGILFLPGVIFWSSGILKDTLSMAALGLLFYCFYQYFIFKKNRVIYLLAIIISIYIIVVVKYYIITAFAITFLVVGVLYILFKIKPLQKRVFFSFILFCFLLLLVFTDNFLSDIISNLSTDMITGNIERMQRLYVDNKEAGEGNFSIGTITPTPAGILAKVPVAIGTVLYRPFIWETRSFIMLFSGLENIILLLLSVVVIFRAGVFNFFRLIAKSSLLQFCFFFTIIFATIVGLTTFNFGTMLRYKVPCMPFYTCFLILLNYYALLKKKEKVTSL